MTDAEIVKLFFARTEQALQETQAKYGNYCSYIAGQILSSPQDREECLNDVLKAAWNSIPPQKPQNLKTYLGKLTRRISLSRLRADCAGKRCPRAFLSSLEELEEIASDDDFTSLVETENLSRVLSEFLRTLPPTKRNLMIRRYWYHDSIQSIGERYGLREGNVKVTLQRTREKLAEYLKKEGWTP